MSGHLESREQSKLRSKVFSEAENQCAGSQTQAEETLTLSGSDDGKGSS